MVGVAYFVAVRVGVIVPLAFVRGIGEVFRVSF